MEITTTCEGCGKETPFLKQDGRLSNLCPECRQERKEGMKTVDIRDLLKRPEGCSTWEWPYSKFKKEKEQLLQLLEEGPIDFDTIDKLKLNCAVNSIRRHVPTVVLRKHLRHNIYNDAVIALEKDFEKAKELLNTRYTNWCFSRKKRYTHL